jgi:hypothetical protein
MTTTRLLPVLLLPTLLVACGGKAEQPGAVESAPAVATGVGSGPQPPAASSGPIAEQSPPQPIPGMPGTAPAAGAAVVMATQDTNWSGVVAEVTEFRRRGNTLTAKVRLRNTSGAEVQPEVKFEDVYLMDAANARKYEVLRDEKGAYIASLRSGWQDRWYQQIEPAQQQTIWIKFPAPPAEVRAITLQLPNTPPFEDLAIQDG